MKSSYTRFYSGIINWFLKLLRRLAFTDQTKTTVFLPRISSPQLTNEWILLKMTRPSNILSMSWKRKHKKQRRWEQRFEHCYLSNLSTEGVGKGVRWQSLREYTEKRSAREQGLFIGINMQPSFRIKWTEWPRHSISSRDEERKGQKVKHSSS